jgi:hypothetical protein
MTMPNVTDVLATAQAIIDHHDRLLATAPRPMPLAPPRRWPMPLLHRLRTLIGSWTTCRFMAKPRINPDYPRQEMVTDCVARIDPYVYIRSLSG